MGRDGVNANIIICRMELCMKERKCNMCDAFRGILDYCPQCGRNLEWDSFEDDDPCIGEEDGDEEEQLDNNG